MKMRIPPRRKKVRLRRRIRIVDENMRLGGSGS